MNTDGHSAGLRNAVFAYSMFCYFVHWLAILYTIGFLINFVVPKSVDVGLTAPTGIAIVVDLGVIGLFAGAHWLMAQAWFKTWWTKFIPTPIERSTYVLVSSILLGLICYAWQPIPTVLWQVEHALGRFILLVLYWAGWTLAIAATFPINHWDLFGVRQGYLFFEGIPYTEPTGYDSILYKYIPHPIFFGYAVAIWATPQMSIGHALLAAGLTTLLIVAVWARRR